MSRSIANELRKKLARFPASGVLSRAKSLYRQLITNWDAQRVRERQRRRKALTVVEANIEAIRNMAQDRTAAYLAVLNMLDRLKQMTPSNGHITSIPAMFTATCMALFGEQAKLESWIPKEIEIFRNKYPQSNHIRHDHHFITGTAKTYSRLQNYTSHLGQMHNKIDKYEANTLASNTSTLFNSGTDPIKTLSLVIISLKTFDDLDAAEAKKYMSNVELYAKLVIIREMIFYFALSLMPENNPSAINRVLYQLRMSRVNSRARMEPIYVHSSRRSKLMAYYDGQVYKVTNAYIDIQAGRPRLDTFPGFSCIKVQRDFWKWSKLPMKKDPYISSYDGTGAPCRWRIVSHGQNLYSIVNKYDCPNGPWCDAMWSFDLKGSNNPIITIKKNNAILWEIQKNPQGGSYK